MAAPYYKGKIERALNGYRAIIYSDTDPSVIIQEQLFSDKASAVYWLFDIM